MDVFPSLETAAYAVSGGIVSAWTTVRFRLHRIEEKLGAEARARKDLENRTDKSREAEIHARVELMRALVTMGERVTRVEANQTSLNSALDRIEKMIGALDSRMGEMTRELGRVTGVLQGSLFGLDPRGGSNGERL